MWEILIELGAVFWPWRRVPDVTGKHAAFAVSELRDRDLRVEGAEEGATGIVVAQHPAPGTRCRRGRPVQLLIDGA